jgi:D,D-heptose 1,7-bisphosphate phosphatase
MALSKAIFLDKDGTIIPDIPFNTDPAMIRFHEGAGEALKEFSTLGYLLVIISNQPGIARGYFQENQLQKVSDKMQSLASLYAFKFSGFYYCPHDSRDHCPCRKPKPGLILRAAKDLGIDVSKSWMIGDILNDVEAGHAAGCKSVLIDNGGETEWLIKQPRIPELVCSKLMDALNRIRELEERQ